MLYIILVVFPRRPHRPARPGQTDRTVRPPEKYTFEHNKTLYDWYNLIFENFWGGCITDSCIQTLYFFVLSCFALLCFALLLQYVKFITGGWEYAEPWSNQLIGGEEEAASVQPAGNSRFLFPPRRNRLLNRCKPRGSPSRQCWTPNCWFKEASHIVFYSWSRSEVRL